MYRTYSAALTAVIALTVTSLGAAQQATNDTVHHTKPSATRDQRQDRRMVATDSTRLRHDIAVRDSLRSALEADHDRTHAATLRADSLRTALAAATKPAPD